MMSLISNEFDAKPGKFSDPSMFGFVVVVVSVCVYVPSGIY